MLATLSATESRKEAFAAVSALIKQWKPLLTKFARNANDQKECIVAMEVRILPACRMRQGARRPRRDQSVEQGLIKGSARWEATAVTQSFEGLGLGGRRTRCLGLKV